MEQRLLFDGIHVHRDGQVVDQRIEGTAQVLTDSAYAQLAFFYQAAVGAKRAGHIAIVASLVEHGFMHSRSLFEL